MSANNLQLPSIDELNTLLGKLAGVRLPKPEGKTLAGHASGLPFEDLIHSALESRYGNQVLRQHDSLNRLLLNNPQAKTAQERTALFENPAIEFLLKRGTEAMKTWSPDNLFDVKQDDTAESIFFDNTTCDFKVKKIYLIDVKTQDISKKAQAPNIISADKLARACVFALRQPQEIPFEIIYVGIKWGISGNELECKDLRVISLMKIPPNLYINWVAAQQIQFHPFEVEQTFEGSNREWCIEYVNNFCKRLKGRIEKEQDRLKFFEEALHT